MALNVVRHVGQRVGDKGNTGFRRVGGKMRTSKKGFLRFKIKRCIHPPLSTHVPEKLHLGGIDGVVRIGWALVRLRLKGFPRNLMGVKERDMKRSGS